jgi:hypothetical protein
MAGRGIDGLKTGLATMWHHVRKVGVASLKKTLHDAGRLIIGEIGHDIYDMIINLLDKSTLTLWVVLTIWKANKQCSFAFRAFYAALCLLCWNTGGFIGLILLAFGYFSDAPPAVEARGGNLGARILRGLSDTAKVITDYRKVQEAFSSVLDLIWETLFGYPFSERANAPIYARIKKWMDQTRPWLSEEDPTKVLARMNRKQCKELVALSIECACIQQSLFALKPQGKRFTDFDGFAARASPLFALASARLKTCATQKPNAWLILGETRVGKEVFIQYVVQRLWKELGRDYDPSVIYHLSNMLDKFLDGFTGQEVLHIADAFHTDDPDKIAEFIAMFNKWCEEHPEITNQAALELKGKIVLALSLIFMTSNRLRGFDHTYKMENPMAFANRFTGVLKVVSPARNDHQISTSERVMAMTFVRLTPQAIGPHGFKWVEVPGVLTHQDAYDLIRTAYFNRQKMEDIDYTYVEGLPYSKESYHCVASPEDRVAYTFQGANIAIHHVSKQLSKKRTLTVSGWRDVVVTDDDVEFYDYYGNRRLESECSEVPNAAVDDVASAHDLVRSRTPLKKDKEKVRPEPVPIPPSEPSSPAVEEDDGSELDDSPSLLAGLDEPVLGMLSETDVETPGSSGASSSNVTPKFFERFKRREILVSLEDHTLVPIEAFLKDVSYTEAFRMERFACDHVDRFVRDADCDNTVRANHGFATISYVIDAEVLRKCKWYVTPGDIFDIAVLSTILGVVAALAGTISLYRYLFPTGVAELFPRSDTRNPEGGKHSVPEFRTMKDFVPVVIRARSKTPEPLLDNLVKFQTPDLSLVGTGVFVEGRAILTAAHCTYSTEDTGRKELTTLVVFHKGQELRLPVAGVVRMSGTDIGFIFFDKPVQGVREIINHFFDGSTFPEFREGIMLVPRRKNKVLLNGLYGGNFSSKICMNYKDGKTDINHTMQFEGQYEAYAGQSGAPVLIQAAPTDLVNKICGVHVGGDSSRIKHIVVALVTRDNVRASIASFFGGTIPNAVEEVNKKKPGTF